MVVKKAMEDTDITSHDDVTKMVAVVNKNSI